MTPPHAARRTFLLGLAATLGGCGAIASLDSASRPLDTYDLVPRSGSTTGPRSARTLVVARPDAATALDTDRIMIKPSRTEITYLPEARWSDEIPAVFQDLLIRAISGTGRVRYIGRAQGGPVPDVAVLTRIDAFHAELAGDGTVRATVDVTLTLVDDRDQRVIASRPFSGTAPATRDAPSEVVQAIQTTLDTLLPEMTDWTLQRLA
ncbi:cholesterol transport system auxiliary component [Tranquillimonas rosea]|uniref:Cholesterol transport system auxiliary component n=1 Tax=Tranquillimonas rosea TaxID=641238 RepID=A0A1H9PZD7_9RHOB|nr:ABC-type transport auxiliary lipoprotein family protein [Tranquillimonas rosea]SER53520.1 cholesterol transport system auxiliary component [Tranquillimonas rosea]